MNIHTRARRAGIAAVFCAAAVRLVLSPLPERFLSWVSSPEAAAYALYLDSGRVVRHSPGGARLFFPAESSGPSLPKNRKKPAFSFEDADSLSIYNTSRKSPDAGALLTQPLAWSLTDGAPAVLILSTHTTESYTRDGEAYEESARYRTTDPDYNMLSIGDAVADRLSQGGIVVIRDRELHDYPSYNGSYTDARGSISEYLAQHPSIRLVLDLHRDASDAVGGQLRTEATVNGKESAQLMLVLGTNYDSWQENLSLGLKLHAQLERQAPGITRPLCLRSQRFNQDLSPGALLVEVGAAGNTRAEALLAAEQLADAILALAEGTGEVEN